jgi:O-antigen ligase
MDAVASHLRKPTFDQAVLAMVLAFSATVDWPANVHISGVSGLGAGTMAAAGLIWALFLSRPVIPHHVLRGVLPLIFFVTYSAGTLLWAHTGMDGVQLLVVQLAFLGLILVCARESADDPANGLWILKAIIFVSPIGVGLYALVIKSEPVLGEGVDGLVTPRPFALYSVVVVAVALALWRGALACAEWLPWEDWDEFDWRRAVKRFKWIAAWFLLWAGITTATVALSMSRTAMVACIALFPLAILLRLNAKSLFHSLAVLITGGLLLTAAVEWYQPLHDRFFAYDASMKVGDVSVNASGRTKIWQVLLQGIGNDWMFGKGVASSVVAVKQVFGVRIAQPHNDYLRFYYDTGVVGLGMWLCFAMTFFGRTFANLRLSIRQRTPDYPLHIAALLAFLAISFSMLTDNSICYSFVMIPLAAVMGCSLGAGRSLPRRILPATDNIEFEFQDHPGQPGLIQPRPRKVRSVV